METKLAAFVEEIIAPPGLVDILVNGEVSVLQKTQIFYDIVLHYDCLLPILSSTLQTVTVLAAMTWLFWFLLYSSYDLLFQFIFAGK